MVPVIVEVIEYLLDVGVQLCGEGGGTLGQFVARVGEGQFGTLAPQRPATPQAME